MEDNLYIWTVYKREHGELILINNIPTPYAYIAIKWIVLKEGSKPTEEFILSDDLEKIRDRLRSRGLIFLARAAGDNKDIIESWI